MFDLRLVAADVLKLRRRRGMLSIALLLTLGAVALVFVVMAIQHGNDPAGFGPAGGLENYVEDIGFVAVMALIVGTIVGATAGAQDLDSGVFRDLAATGRSRLALFAARVAGAWVVVLSILGLTAAVTAAGCLALAGTSPAPGAGDVIEGTLMVLASGALSAAMGVGVAALVGSRGPVIGILLAFHLAIVPLLQQVSLLGSTREVLPIVALNRIGDQAQAVELQVALLTAILAVVGWGALALGAGAWRTRTREI
jgi:hypothetical protein